MIKQIRIYSFFYSMKSSKKENFKPIYRNNYGSIYRNSKRVL